LLAEISFAAKGNYFPTGVSCVLFLWWLFRLQRK